MKTRLVSSLALLALAACNADSASPDAEPATEAVAPTQTAAPAAAPPPATTPSAGATPVVMDIPPAAQGRWGLVPADCTSTRGDAKGLLIVEPRTLRFYESRGTLRDITDYSETRIRGVFDFTGEGMTWERDMALEVQDGGRTLVREEYGREAAPGEFRYTKCS